MKFDLTLGLIDRPGQLIKALEDIDFRTGL